MVQVFQLAHNEMQVMDAAPIQYAPVQPGEKRRRIARKVVLAFALLLTTPVLWKCATVALHRGQMLYWQRRSMNHVARADSVVYDTSGTNWQPAAVEWKRFNELYSPPGRLPLATIFLHERKNTRGERRLVAVECLLFPGDGVGDHLYINQSVFKPGSLFDEPNEVQEHGANLLTAGFANYWPGSRVRIFAGQADPADDTHFSFECEVDGKRTIMDGYLGADDKIDFSNREVK